MTDVVVGDITDPEVLTRAMQGVLHRPDPGSPRTGNGQRRHRRRPYRRRTAFRLRLGAHSIITDFVQHETKRDLEEYLLSSGMEFTILQPANYMVRHRLLPAFEQGVFRLSWPLDRYHSMVELGDVAEVAAAVLADSDRYAGATYELVAPGRYTAHDLAKAISEITGRAVTAEQIDSDTFTKAALGTEDLTRFPYRTRAARATSKRYSSHDFIGNPNVLTWLLGWRPTTFDQFVQRKSDAFSTAAHHKYVRTDERP